jgi:hypothetical protein
MRIGARRLSTWLLRSVIMRLLARTVLGLLLLMPAMHCLAQGAAPTAAITDAQRKAVVAALGQKLEANYVFPDLASKVAATLAAKATSDGYDAYKDTNSFADALTKDLHTQTRDLHFEVDYQPDFKEGPHDGQAPSKEDIAEMKSDATRMGYGIVKVQRLPGNVGYLDIRAFFSADFVAPAYSSALNLLSGTDMLIIDLRQNGGGDPGAVAALLSHFFAEGDDRHLNDLYWRPGNRTQEFWTIPVTGERYLKPVYVLTSAATFSGGEECAYDFQTQKRATLIGEKTAGGANPGDAFSLGNGFAIFIPTGRAINPITKTNWEHVGVTPDIAVPAEDAFKTAYVMALKAQLASAKDDERRNQLKAVLARAEKGQDEEPHFKPPTQ